MDNLCFSFSLVGVDSRNSSAVIFESFDFGGGGVRATVEKATSGRVNLEENEKE